MNFKMKGRSIAEDDEIESILRMDSQCQVYKTSVVCNEYTIIIDEYVNEPSYYRNALATLRCATENDRVNVVINSYGGNLASAIMLRNAMEDCDAEVWCVLEGDTHSAGSLIALSANAGIIVKSHACMMIHHASFGTHGTTQNVVDQVGFYKKRLDKITKEVYSDFLTEDEIKDVINNKEIWLDEYEIGERIQRMYRLRAEKSQAEAAESIDEETLQREPVGTVFEESVDKAVKTAKKRTSKKSTKESK